MDSNNGKFGKIIGFMKEIKESDGKVFKTIAKEKKNIGSTCFQAGKKSVITDINSILDNNFYNASSKKTPAKNELCVIQEILLRTMDKEKKDNKRWFLNPVEIYFVESNRQDLKNKIK